MMRKIFPGVLGICLLGATLGSQLNAQAKTAEPPKLKVGDAAPDFKLQYFDGKDLKDVSLSEYRGKKNVVLAFYIFAFTGG
jgi:AhpC/TSA family